MPDQTFTQDNPEQPNEPSRSVSEHSAGSVGGAWSEEEASRLVDVADPSSAPESGQP